MKTASAICALLIACSSVGSADAWDMLAALRGQKQPHKKHHVSKHDDPMGIMGSIMAAAQTGMAKAQLHHEKAVSVARQNITNLLQQETKVLSQGILRFNDELLDASAGLQDIIDLSDRVLEKAAKAEAAAANQWDSSLQMEHVELQAHRNGAEQIFQKGEQKRKRSTQEAVQDAEMVLEGGVEKLDMKVGDISKLVKDAQTSLEDATASLPDAKASNASIKKKNNQTMGASNAGTMLVAAASKADTDRKVAKQNFQALIAKVEKDLAAGSKAIKDSLAIAQEEEFETIHGAAAPIAPVKSSLRRHQHK